MVWVLLQVGVTNGVLRGLGGLTKLHTLHVADAYRVTNAGLHFISHLTGAHPSSAAESWDVSLVESGRGVFSGGRTFSISLCALSLVAIVRSMILLIMGVFALLASTIGMGSQVCAGSLRCRAQGP